MADAPKSTEQIQVLAKQEETAGTYISLDADDSQGRISKDTSVETNQEEEARDVARSSKTPLAPLSGEKLFGINIKQEANTPDTITDPPENKVLIDACGNEIEITACEQLDIGAVASGPFVRNEVITQTDTAATGRVLIECADGATRIVYELLTGTMETGKLLTGGTSSATATTSSGPTGAGSIIRPISASEITASIEKQEDGYAWSIAGAMGNMILTLEASKKAMWDFAFQGPKNTAGDKALTADIAYMIEQPPIVQGADCQLNDVEVIFSLAVLDEGNRVVPRKSGNVANTGILASYIPGRVPTLKVSCELPPSASLDVDGLQAAGTEIPFKAKAGTVIGKMIYLFVDNAVIVDTPLGDSDGIRTVDLLLKCVGDPTDTDGDDEFEIVIV